MEWTGAKRFVIIILVILNVALAVLNMRQRSEDSMSSAQERAIYEVLSKNGITMYTELTDGAEPMLRLEAKVPGYTKEIIEESFFEGERTRVSLLSDGSRYFTEERSLTLKGDSGVFIREDIDKGIGELSRDSAISVAEAEMTKLDSLFGEADIAYTFEMEDGWQVVFSGVYNDMTIFSNEFKFYVSEAGIFEIDFTYCRVEGTSGEVRDICLSDEALLTFMREWRENGETRTASIQRLELGYDLLEQGEAAEGADLFLEPCYRIILMEEREPYIVNAYTCELVNKTGSAASADTDGVDEDNNTEDETEVRDTDQ